MLQHVQQPVCNNLQIKPHATQQNNACDCYYRNVNTITHALNASCGTLTAPAQSARHKSTDKPANASRPRTSTNQPSNGNNKQHIQACIRCVTHRSVAGSSPGVGGGPVTTRHSGSAGPP